MEREREGGGSMRHEFNPFCLLPLALVDYGWRHRRQVGETSHHRQHKPVSSRWSVGSQVGLSVDYLGGSQ